MPTVGEITQMCKEGHVAEAYDVAKNELGQNPDNEWSHRMMGWALYYKLKDDADGRRTDDFCNHLQELLSLNLLSFQNDSMIFENVLWKIAALLNGVSNENFLLIERLFPLLQPIVLMPSKAYTVLLKSVIKFEGWSGLVPFFEWWGIENLIPEDYEPFVNAQGRKIMSVAEQVYIAYSKALLKLHDADRIASFLPKIRNLIDVHPEMMYPGYFCGKLMLELGHGRENALDILVPFARKKRGEFWVWQLLAEFYKDDADMQLACLLRATHCNAEETFLGKVRIRLICEYLSRGDYARAKCHIDKITKCYLQQGWRLPFEVQNWIREPWVNNSVADNSDAVDYKKCTDEILLQGTNESVALVTYVDVQKKRAIIVYGEKLRASVKISSLGGKVKSGALLKLCWMPGKNGAIDIYASSLLSDIPAGITYIKRVRGRVAKRDGDAFAFVQADGMHCYMSPQLVQRSKVENNDEVDVLVVLDYNKGKDKWNWVCSFLNKE